MFVPLWLLITAGLLALALVAAFVYACRLVWKGNTYNKRLFVQVLTEKEANAKLAADVRRLQRGRQHVNGFSQQKQ
jgi:hypothetical protein